MNPFASDAHLPALASVGSGAPPANQGLQSPPAALQVAGLDAAAAVSPPTASGQMPQEAPAPTSLRWSTSVAGIIADPVLSSRLDQALVGMDGHLGVAVKDLGSGRGAVLDGNLELQSASLYKLPVLYTVFDLGLS